MLVMNSDSEHLLKKKRLNFTWQLKENWTIGLAYMKIPPQNQ